MQRQVIARRLLLFLERAFARTRDAQLARQIAAFRRKLARFFAMQGNALARKLKPSEKLREADSPLDWETEWDEVSDDTEDQLLTASLEAISAAMATGGKTTIAEMGVELDFSLKNPRAVAWLKNRAAELVKGLDATTQDAIREIVTDGAAEGLSYAKIAREIRAKFRDFSRQRSKTIAVTELGNGYEQGTLEAARQITAVGVDVEKSWLTVGDDRVDPECAENEAQGWIDLDDDFQSGVARPLQHPNCRCTLLTRRKKEK